MRNPTDKHPAPSGLHSGASALPCALAALIALAALSPQLAAQPAGTGAVPGENRFPDTLTTSEGNKVNGKITAMQDGKIYVEGEGGIKTYSKEEVSGFNIQRGGSDEVNTALLQRMLDNQAQIAQRIEELAVSLVNLERQLLAVQSNQQIQARRLSERTVEVNPISRVSVVDWNINRRNGNTVVEGRVINQSESMVGNLQVQAALFASRGQIASRGGVLTGVGSVSPATLAPGQAGTYQVMFDGFLIVDNVQVQVAAPGTYGGIPYQALPGQVNPAPSNFGEY
jgi:hypothetical protein